MDKQPVLGTVVITAVVQVKEVMEEGGNPTTAGILIKECLVSLVIGAVLLSGTATVSQHRMALIHVQKRRPKISSMVVVVAEEAITLMKPNKY